MYWFIILEVSKLDIRSAKLDLLSDEAVEVVVLGFANSFCGDGFLSDFSFCFFNSSSRAFQTDFASAGFEASSLSISISGLKFGFFVSSKMLLLLLVLFDVGSLSRSSF